MIIIIILIVILVLPLLIMIVRSWAPSTATSPSSGRPACTTRPAADRQLLPDIRRPTQLLSGQAAFKTRIRSAQPASQYSSKGGAVETGCSDLYYVIY